MDRLLIDYIPDVLKEVREYKATFEAEQVECDLLKSNIDNVLKDQFVLSAMENGILRLEAILKITPKSNDTLKDRRFRILTKLNAQLPYTYKKVKQMLEALCGEDGFTFEVNVSTFLIMVKVALTAKSNFNDVQNLMHSICPANMVVKVELKYNQNQLFSTYKHNQLSQHSHYYLRNEVINNGN